MTKIKNLKAIHNEGSCATMSAALVQYDKDKEFESNSQPNGGSDEMKADWFSMTKIKNLKAIHNLNAKPIILYLTDFSVATDVIYVNVICLAYLQSGNDVLYLPCNS